MGEDLLGTVLEIENFPYNQMAYEQTRISLREWDAKRETSMKTLPENQESCRAWRWRRYQLQLEHLEQSPKALKEDWKSLKSEDDSILSRLHH